MDTQLLVVVSDSVQCPVFATTNQEEVARTYRNYNRILKPNTLALRFISSAGTPTLIDE